IGVAVGGGEVQHVAGHGGRGPEAALLHASAGGGDFRIEPARPAHRAGGRVQSDRVRGDRGGQVDAVAGEDALRIGLRACSQIRGPRRAQVRDFGGVESAGVLGSAADATAVLRPVSSSLGERAATPAPATPAAAATTGTAAAARGGGGGGGGGGG